MNPAELARLRQAAYRLFSQSLLYPDGQRLETIGIVAQELIRQSETWASFAFFGEWSRFLDALTDLRHQDPAAIQSEYVSNFRVNRAGIPCPLYASVYLTEDPSEAAYLLSRLEAKYAEVGLAPSPSLKEAPDHVAVELEFMSFLCNMEAQAWEEEDLPRARESLEREIEFLRAHLTRWFPGFAGRVAAAAGNSAFARAASAAQAFLVHDIDLAEGLLVRFEGAEGVG